MTNSTHHYTPDLGALIRRRREALGLTRPQLIPEADVSIGFLTNVEAGAVPKRSVAVARILAALDRLEHERTTTS